MSNPRVFMDIAIDGQQSGLIIIELFADTTPLTANTFLSLCTGKNPSQINYKGDTFRHVVYGDSRDEGALISSGNQELESVYNSQPENFIKKHDKPGTVSIHSKGPSFFISTMKLSRFDDKHVVVGQVLEGFDIVMKSMRSLLPVVITDCGEIPRDQKIVRNPRVYMDITLNGKTVGRMVIELFANTTPKAAENFRVLCTGEKGPTLHYKGSPCHHVGTGIFHGGPSAGKHELESMYGCNAKSENFIKKHDKAGTVSTKTGPDFFISATARPSLDGENMVVGQVVEGITIINAINKARLSCKLPSLPIAISDCGELRDPVISPVSAPLKTSTIQLEPVIPDSNKQFSLSSKGIRNPRVYMDIVIDDKPTGRIEIELFADTTPKTAENFLLLCTGEKGKGLHYKGTTLHRVTDNICKGGEITEAGKRELRSIYGVNPKPENFIKKHDKPGTVWMPTSGGPSFLISNRAMPPFNGKNVVVGQVVEGIHIVNHILKLRHGDFIRGPLIADCGQLSDRAIAPISASQKTSITKLGEVVCASTKQFSISLNEASNVKKQLAEVDSKDILVSGTENELVDFTGSLEKNIGVLSDLKAEVCSLEKCENELLSQTSTRITNIKNKKLVLEMISSLPDEDLVNIESEIKKRKKGCH